MNDLAKNLMHLMLEAGVMKFGSFQTKSGRTSPYFFNFGGFCTGEQVGALADIYAEFIAAEFPRVENLFGPAYKGIPLAVMTADRLTKLLGRTVTFSFDRKEIKDHGEGGWLVGYEYQGGEKCVVVEDVITGGTSLRHTLPRLQSAGVEVLGAALGVDRMERGTGELAAAEEIADQYGIRVKAVTNVDAIVDYLHGAPILGKVWIDDRTKDAIDQYLREYGSRS